MKTMRYVSNHPSVLKKLGAWHLTIQKGVDVHAYGPSFYWADVPADTEGEVAYSTELIKECYRKGISIGRNTNQRPPQVVFFDMDETLLIRDKSVEFTSETYNEIYTDMLAPGADEIVKTLMEKDIKYYILSAASQSTVDILARKIRANGGRGFGGFHCGGKGDDVRDICEKLDIPVSETAAVGDSISDLDMLQETCVKVLYQSPNYKIEKLHETKTMHNLGRIANMGLHQANALNMSGDHRFLIPLLRLT